MVVVDGEPSRSRGLPASSMTPNMDGVVYALFALVWHTRAGATVVAASPAVRATYAVSWLNIP